MFDWLEREARSAFKVARSRGLQVADAEDAAQETALLGWLDPRVRGSVIGHRCSIALARDRARRIPLTDRFPARDPMEVPFEEPRGILIRLRVALGEGAAECVRMIADGATARECWPEVSEACALKRRQALLARARRVLA